jgi:hypothetical protein
MNFKSIAIATTIAAIPLIVVQAPAQASAYRSAGGGTVLEIRENATYAPFPTPSTPVGLGEYKTAIGGQNWHGNFNAPLIASSPSTKIYQGTFQDSNSSGSQTCTGTIKITRTGTTNFATTVLWTITGGAGCPVSGTTSTVANMPERIPVVSNVNGDYLSAQANTLGLPASNPYTWSVWKVVDPTPLNCRATANSSASVITTFSTGALINTQNLGATNNIVMSSGQPWIGVQYQVKKYCYVRANSARIIPKSLPF